MASENNRSKQQVLEEIRRIFPGLPDGEKLKLFSDLGIVVVHARTGRDPKNRRLILPGNLRQFGALLPEITHVALSLDYAYQALSRGELDIGNAEIIKVLSASRYFREKDPEGKPMGDELGLVEEIMLKLRAVRDEISKAIESSRTAVSRQRRERRAKARPDQNRQESKKASAQQQAKPGKGNGEASGQEETPPAETKPTPKKKTTAKTRPVSAEAMG